MVETRAFTPLCNYSQLGFGGVAHEEQDIHMAGFPVGDKEFSISFGITLGAVKNTGTLVPSRYILQY